MNFLKRLLSHCGMATLRGDVRNDDSGRLGMSHGCYQARLLRSPGRHAHRQRGRAQGRVPQARHAASSRPQSGRQRERAQIQGDSTRPTTCSRTATSARPMTASATPPSSKAAAAADTASAPISPRPSPTSSKTCSAWAAAGAAAAGAGGRERGSDLRYNMEISLEEAFAGKTAQIRIPTSGHLRSLLGLRRQGRHQAEGLRDLRRRRQDPACAGLLHARAHLPGLSGPRPGHRRPVPVLRRRRPRHARAHALGQYPGRCRGRHPHPAGRRRRGRRARRPAGRSLYFPVAGAA